MKKFNRLIALVLFIYLILAAMSGAAIFQYQQEQSKAYRVEINRLYSSLNSREALGHLTFEKCEFVKGIESLPAADFTSRQKTDAFFRPKNESVAEIKPWYLQQKFVGILRFDYQPQKLNMRILLAVVESPLLLIAVFALILLLYLKKRLIQPFNRMSDLPYEMAKGHLKNDVKEERNRYFGRFLWGLGALKDSLDISRKRTLELEREKKLMLLSLSHDIKTPLNTIALYSRALENGIYNTAQQKKQAVRQIGEKGRQIEQYVEKIMQTSREDILDIQVEDGEFYLKDLMDKVLGTYREKCALRALDLEVRPYENRLLSGDLERVMEVFENLFENAFKYGDGRQMKISFREEDYCQLIQVFNTGRSVDDNDFNHIFESFFRGSNCGSRSGSGLGLYICREIMRKIGGEIFAQQEPDGMTFVLVFR